MGEKIAIIGAGIAGLTAARTLADAGHDMTVFEKSGGTGGRLSTRRTEHGNFDHGAQYIAAKGKPFRALLTGLANHGAVAFWAPEGKDRENEWHVGVPGMSALVKPLLGGFELLGKTRIASMKVDGSEIICMTESGDAHRFDRVICAIPSPQTLELLGPIDDAFQALSDVVYGPCWSAMFAFDDAPENLPAVYRGDHDSALGWVAHNATKQGREGKNTYVVHGGGNWSRAHLEIEEEQSCDLLFAALKERFGALPAPAYSTGHRWRYAHVDTPLGQPYLAGAGARVFAIGDGMLGGRVEAAFESAQQLCDHLKENVIV